MPAKTINMKDYSEIKNLIEKVHSDRKLSTIEQEYLEKFGLSIENDGNYVKLMQKGKILVKVKYYTVGCLSQAEWDDFDRQFEKVNIKIKD